MRYTYRSGQRPLDGYTIKRGVGQGGFGEVYFAVSDGGKEVALKLLRGHTDVELRGVANCLNLKNPNLVHVYDLKKGDAGEHWLVMEYVLGESLAQVIARHPHGLPTNLVCDWFVNLTRAVGCLHDHGVVHRDLKPANIFIENGMLKVGDYGLCKTLHASHKRQTQTVGTVHYMAPEVSTGNYNKQIDIYACGVILHEMLTGELPFDGESDGEILMKHLTAQPDLSRLPKAFQPIVAKALDKNAIKRYATIVEMARAVEAVSLPTAVPLPPPPMAKPIPAATMQTQTQTQSGQQQSHSGGQQQQQNGLPQATPPFVQVEAPRVAQPIPQLAVTKVANPVGVAWRDRLTDISQGMLFLPLIAVIALIPFAVIAKNTEWATTQKLFLLTVLLGWSMLIVGSQTRYRAVDSWFRRMWLAILGLGVGAVAFWLDGWPMPSLVSDPSSVPTDELFILGQVQMSKASATIGMQYLIYFATVMGIGRWWRAVARDRKERFSMLPLLAAAFWGFVFSFVWPWSSGSVWLGVVPLILATVTVQLVSPWSPPPPPAPRKLRYRA